MLTWDELEHGNLHVDDMLRANNRRKKHYRQMAITINGGPMGKGIRIQHPKCLVNDVHTIFPDPDRNYVALKDD
jgi:hypothetical protein